MIDANAKDVLTGVVLRIEPSPRAARLNDLVGVALLMVVLTPLVIFSGWSVLFASIALASAIALPLTLSLWRRRRAGVRTILLDESGLRVERLGSSTRLDWCEVQRATHSTPYFGHRWRLVHSGGVLDVHDDGISPEEWSSLSRHVRTLVPADADLRVDVLHWLSVDRDA